MKARLLDGRRRVERAMLDQEQVRRAKAFDHYLDESLRYEDEWLGKERAEVTKKLASAAADVAASAATPSDLKKLAGSTGSNGLPRKALGVVESLGTRTS